jgi:hypothetical protein
MCFLAAAAACALAFTPSADYRYLVVSGVDGPWQALRNGQAWQQGSPAQTFLAAGIDGVQKFDRDGQLPLEEGTLEMRVALSENGDSPTYQQNRVLFSYRAANGDNVAITQAGAASLLYFGGTVRAQWESAYGSRGMMRSWQAGEWHHLAATWSAQSNRMRFYLDGVLTADTNEGQYWPPDASGAQFTLDASVYGMRDVVIWNRALDLDELKAHAARTDHPQAGEVWLQVAGLRDGDQVSLRSGECSVEPVAWTGLPIRNPQPPSTLLTPGTTAINFTVDTAVPATCRYSVNQKLLFSEMAPLDGRIEGLSGDSHEADLVYVRCSNAPDYALRLLYRSVSTANPHFPRKSNLWGSGNMLKHGYDFAAKVDVYLGAELPPADIRALRARNPEILVLTSINTVENRGLPEDYYLHDTTGSRIEVWPGTYRLNLTKPYVAEYQAQFAYQKMIESDLMYDGCFFDNFFTTQSWLKADIHGRAVQLDADEDGKPDDPAWLDKTWREGVFHELEIWRQLMPAAYASGHLPNPVTPEVAPIFNGNSILFWAPNVQDGKTPFADFWNVYQGWSEQGRAPSLTTIETSPQNQVAYGYGYDIQRMMPVATQQFARDYYPYLRFGLAVTLMRDGSFHRDLGDIYHGIDWWYDEYDFDLGYPTGPAELVASGDPAPNRVLNAGFEQDLKGTWNLVVDSRTPGPAQATLTRDTDSAEGSYSARLDVTVPSTDWHVELSQRDVSLRKGVSYDLTFWAKASAVRALSVSTQEQVAPWSSYGLSQRVTLGTTWKRYKVTFEANATASDSRLQFFVGDTVGKVWIDDVELRETPAQVWRRYFTKGAVLVNGTREAVTVAMPDGYEHFMGDQAPRYQYIVDDEDAGFTAGTGWKSAKFDTGQWKSAGPFYHHWGTQCHVLDEAGSAQWELRIPADGTYTIEGWWAAAPEQSGWTRSALYEVVAGGVVVASAILDQTQSGDQWRKIVTVDLRAADRPVLRIRNGASSGRVVADGIHLWSADRLNDGTPAASVTVAPLDGVLLHRR